jgi:dTDP-4-amino-4,6-dideoxygalactose transaminase
MDHIPFNRPYPVGTESGHIDDAIERGHLSGDGEYTRRCAGWLEERTNSLHALLTPSCTSALEIAAVLAGVGPGDEVIMPSFTFVSTANAFVLRGATPVFVDIRPDTLNLDETQVEAAVTPAARAIVPVHYAGVACEMDGLGEIAERHELLVIEDAAQGMLSSYRGRPLGSIGQLGTLSFHETKNVTCGEGGALLVNDDGLIERAEIVREKGTNRSQFYRGQVDKYTWVDIGSSHVMSELSAAFLWGQLGQADEITGRRLAIWRRYHDAFEGLEAAGLARRPIVPDDCRHNAHLYYLLLSDAQARNSVLDRLNQTGVNAVFHYIPLHSSPAGRKYGRAVGELPVTDDAAGRLLRLPLYTGMPDEAVEQAINAVCESVQEIASTISARSKLT